MKPEREVYLDRVREIVVRALADYGATIYLFGSHATGAARRSSDVDVAVDQHEPLSATVLTRLREALEESTVPYRVDIVDLSSADAALRRRVRREGVVWNASASA